MLPPRLQVVQLALRELPVEPLRLEVVVECLLLLGPSQLTDLVVLHLEAPLVLVPLLAEAVAVALELVPLLVAVRLRHAQELELTPRLVEPALQLVMLHRHIVARAGAGVAARVGVVDGQGRVVVVPWS